MKLNRRQKKKKIIFLLLLLFFIGCKKQESFEVKKIRIEENEEDILLSKNLNIEKIADEEGENLTGIPSLDQIVYLDSKDNIKREKLRHWPSAGKSFEYNGDIFTLYQDFFEIFIGVNGDRYNIGPSLGHNSSAAIANNGIYILGEEGIYFFNPEDRESFLLLELNEGIKEVQDISVDDGKIYIGEKNRLWIYDMEREKWETVILGENIVDFFVKEDSLIGLRAVEMEGPDKQSILIYNFKKNKIYDTNIYAYDIFSAIIIDDEIIIGSDSGLYKLNWEKGIILIENGDFGEFDSLIRSFGNIVFKNSSGEIFHLFRSDGYDLNWDERFEIKKEFNEYINLDINHISQINEDYCGPAAVEMVYRYLNEGDLSQEIFGDENHLSTNHIGTVMPDIVEVLNRYQDYEYKYVEFGSIEEWELLIRNTLDLGKPIIIDINSLSTEVWPYLSPGHYMIISALSFSEDGDIYVKILDPWRESPGIYWVDIDIIYEINHNHFRSAIIH